MQQRNVYSTFWSQLEKKNNTGCAEKKEKETKELLYERLKSCFLAQLVRFQLSLTYTLWSKVCGYLTITPIVYELVEHSVPKSWA